MSNDELEKLLNSVDKYITALTKKAYDKLLKMVLDGISPQEAQKHIINELAIINDGSADIIAASLNSFLAASVTSEYVKDFEVHGVKLSKRMYANARDVELKTMKVINHALKQKKSINEISKLLYEGYNFKEDPLNVKRKSTIPKWLKDELNKPPSQRSFKQVGTIKTKALKAAYTQALKEENAIHVEKQLERAFYEKSRYYANRIAQNEVMKSYSVERAKMIRDDDDIEVVKVRMSRTHERVDICDYHSKVNKYGLGGGVYPKAKAPIPPFHPWCRCRLVEDITRSAKGAKFNPKADKEVMQKFNSYEQSLILGSQKRRDAFLKNPKDVLKASYIGSPMYIDEVDSVKYVGYNSTMDLKTMLNEVKSSKKLSKNKIVVGTLDDSVIAFLKDRSVPVHTNDIYINSKGLSHLARDSKKKRGAGLSDNDILKIPGILKHPSSIYFETIKNKFNVLYCDVKTHKCIKIVIDTKFVYKGEKITLLKTAGYVKEDNLNDERLIII